MIKNKIKTIKVIDIKEECKDVKTFTLDTTNLLERSIETPKPGQFVMIWVPGEDEIPMSVSGIDDRGNWQITVKKVGECTGRLFNLGEDNFLGVRGPFGNSFKLPNQNGSKIFLVGGGTGLAPLRFLAKILRIQKKEFILLEGAKEEAELMYIAEFEEIKDNQIDSDFYFCTEDGSFGEKGLVTDIFESIIETNIKNGEIGYVYSCGPEKMLYRIFQISQEFEMELQVSLERIMRCGCGICGLCSIDPLGLLVCKDGPVFSKQQLLKMDDFGKFKRDFSGKKIQI